MAEVFHLADVPGWRGVLPALFLHPPRPSFDHMVESGENYGRQLFTADMALWLVKVEENSAFASDLLMWFAYFRVKAILISEMVVRAKAEGTEHPHFYDAIKRGYRDGVCDLVTERVQAWKKRALIGKKHFNFAVKLMPMASQVFVFPNDPPHIDPSWQESARRILDGLPVLAGLR